MTETYFTLFEKSEVKYSPMYFRMFPITPIVPETHAVACHTLCG